ncbi:MAG: hypothetical protein DME22_24900 [Verrucomicrobia bacterium]|nr:MAG: hypothetical protein DME22_24900 [Verrucomicrobiota bacterium]PYK01010.1 MAG: hypothetical protein DME23_05355 [Verrucomicrobiota bacterium]
MTNALQRLIAEIAEQHPAARIEFDPLPSGVCFLDVWIGERMFDLEYNPKRGVGVSEIKNDTPPFTGHDHVFTSLDEAVAFYKRLLAEAKTQTATA